jgi:SAM-dependent methyltransferase
MRCLDLGCGGGDVTLALARLVGPRGEATGLDLDSEKIDLAIGQALAAGLTNARFRQADVEDWSEPGRYDLVYCRFLLTHLYDPLAVLRKMREAVRPGGMVVVEDLDIAGRIWHPPCPALDGFGRLYRSIIARRGGDADIGPKLYGLARAAGLANVDLDVVTPTFASGEGKAIALLSLANITDAVLQDGLASEKELRAMRDEVAAYTEREDTILSLPRIFQVWGTRGEGEA